MFSSGPRWVLATTLLLVLEATTSFQVVPRKVIQITTQGQGHSLMIVDNKYLESRRGSSWLSLRNPRKPKDMRNWATEQDDNDSEQSSTSDSYQGLYEFLTRRNGEQAGESERRRKRDRILEWMGSGTTSTTAGGGSNLVRPIRVEDGSIMEEDPPRTKARFDRLFSGMPTLDEILSRDDSSATGKTTLQDTSTSEGVESNKKVMNASDDSWFVEEKKQIEAEYEQIIKDVNEQIRQQRREDPDAMPENAEGVAESIVRQELDRMLKSIKLTRAKERLQDYEINKKTELDSRDMTGATDEVVDRILQEAKDEWKRKEALKAEVDDFLRYESDALSTSLDYDIPLPDADLDKWALQRLETMLETSQTKASESGGAVTDILEEQIQSLRERIDKESTKGSIQPQTMKEWQMFRAIATRLGKDRGFDPQIDAVLNLSQTDEDQVAQRLKSWREYVGKEEEIRKRSGLSVGTRMPFDWQTAEKDSGQEAAIKEYSQSRTKSRRELRREVNMQALQAFEDLIQTSDPARAENLKKQLELLRAELEARDFVDVEEGQLEEEKIGPVDLSDVFGSRDESVGGAKLPSRLYEEERDAIDRVLAADAQTVYESYKYESYTPETPPATPFSSDSFYDEKRPPPPKTPFFDETYAVDSEVVDVTNTKLGSADEQKLLNMYRRAGARTKEEQDAIREQWEAFQALEKAKRDASGLSDQDDSDLVGKANLKYDLSEVMKSDGDFDAEKILSAIGPRPTRKKKSTESKKEEDKITNEDSKYQSDLDPAQVSESLFRSVAAVGGGRLKDDIEAREKEKANFEDYLKKEEEFRRSLDSLDEAAKKLALESDVRMDDPSYAQDVLASIGPRPVFKKAKKQMIDEKELSDRGGIVASEDDDSDSEDDDDDSDESSQPGLIPEWLKKEREVMKKKESSGSGFSGRNIDELFDDDKYDHNLRQLHEYEQRRSGRQKQMGIDISEVIGTRARGSDDYADYSYDTDYFRGRQDGWGATSFEARKKNLLEYVELSTPQLNNLMDHRASVYATGVSQYLPRINKPFKEFGAIFRLEGVLVDLTGIQYDAWKKVASEFGFKQPILEDVRRAAVVRPDVAIREIFYWTNDVFVGRKVTSCFRRIFREIFDDWASTHGLSKELFNRESEKGSMALGAEALSDSNAAQSTLARPSPPKLESEQSKLKRYQEAWLLTAKELELSTPSNEQVAKSTFLAPEISVREVFQWTTDQQDIDAVVSVFNAILNGDLGSKQMLSNLSEEGPQSNQKESTLLESQYMAWTRLANENSFEVPSPEEVLAAAVLNDPEIVIIKGFGWTEQATEARRLADQYRKYLNELFKGQAQTISSVPTSLTPSEPIKSPGKAIGPTDEEIIELQIKAWYEAAMKHGFTAPQPDQIQLTLNLSPSDAVRRLLGWTYNFNETQISDITQTYSEALKKASEKYVKANPLGTETVPSPPVPMKPKVQGKELSADDVYQAAFAAWTNVAWESGYSLPDQDQVQFALSVGPEEAIVVGFQWTTSYKDAEEIAMKYRDQIQTKREEWVKKGYVLSSNTSGSDDNIQTQALVSVTPGVCDWIKSLLDVEMACGVTSYLEEDQVSILLQFAGLADLLPRETRVSMSNGYDRDSQQMLGVALRIERRPDHCVLFDSSPGANAAAREVDMRSVSIIGSYPRYELVSADSTASSFDELTAMNIRRLFGERVYDQPMLDMLQNQPQITRKTKTTFWDDE